MGGNIFNSIEVKAPPSNTFDLSHDVKMSAKMGNLTPVCCFEAVPGDRFNISAETFIRFAPMIAPVMHRFDVTIHYWFVPLRILWPSWEEWITNPNSIAVPPYLTYDSATATPLLRLPDYLGLPTPISLAPAEEVLAFNFAAYQMIYQEFYRDQNLIADVPFELIDGDNSANTELYEMRLRAWEHDYFTASLPFAQKGSAVDLPLGDVRLKQGWDTLGSPFFQGVGSTTLGNINNASGPEIDIAGVGPQAYDPDGSLETSPTTINDLRRAYRLQEFLERDARGGTRYAEKIFSHFNVRSSDSRLQRPEYITGVKAPIVVSSVASTAEAGALPQGNLSGEAVGVAYGNYGSYFCEEHGVIMGIMSVMPKPAYQQGIHKMWLKRDQFDYYWPEFAQIGEQEVKRRELFAFIGTAGDDVFGYIPRYGEYKYMPNRVAGEFRTSLDFWHAGRIFPGAPTLNQAFIEMAPLDVDRLFAVSGVDNLYCHVNNKIKARRLMPRYGTPTF